MSISRIAASLFWAAGLSGLAQAQDFGVMQSAETIKIGNFKFAAYPMLVQGKDGAKDDTGIVIRAGHGFTDSFDAEIKLASYDHATYIGVDAEFGLLKAAPIELSIAIGGNVGSGKKRFSDSTNFDLTLTGSGSVGNNLELALSVDLTLVSLDDAAFGQDDSFEHLHVVPGFEYRISQVIDLMGEVGIAVSDEANDYVAVGLAFYLR